MGNILCTSLGSGGDVFPFLHLGSRLKARGHRVTLFSHYRYADAAAEAGIQFSAIDGPEEYSEFVKDEALLNSPSGIAQFLRRHLFPKTLAICELIRQQCVENSTLLLTRDLFDTAARISAEKLKIPLMVLFFAPSQAGTWKIRVELFGQSFAADINRMRDQLGMAAVTDWTAWLSYPSPSIALWPDWFAAADSTWPAGLEPVGFIVDRENESAEIPRELQTFLEEGEPPILITGGTGLYLGSNFYEAAAEACRLLGYRGVLVTQHREQIPKYLPDGVLWVRDVPLTKLLARVAAVIHHGGRGTLSAAIAAGVPQLVLAMGADRPDNAIRLKQLGVADYLLPPGWQPARAAQKLQQLMRSEAVAQRCRTLAVQMAAADGAASACEIVERVLAGVGLPEGTPANGIELG